MSGLLMSGLLMPALLAATLLLMGCAAGDEAASAPAASPAPASPVPSSPAPASPGSADVGQRAVRLVFLGDSLTAGLSLGEEEAFPALVEAELRRRGLEVEVVNAGVSGDTSAGGLRRLDWLLRQHPDLMVVELGGNDGLRGLPVEETETNLRRIVEGARAAGSEVLLVGMQIPSNYGPEYTRAFAEVFPRLARELGVALMPFLLDGVALDPELTLADGLHPNAEGHRRIAESLVPYVEPLVRDLAAKRRAPAE